MFISHNIKNGFLLAITILLLSSFVVSSVSAEEVVNTKQRLVLKLIDKVHQTPLIDAHVCVELDNGVSTYKVSDTNGNIELSLAPSDKGIVTISKVGFVSQFLPVESMKDDITIALAIDVFNIDQVVVTGVAKPTPVDSSIYKVKLISAEKIKKTGAINLAELLVAEANIRMSTDLVLGTQIEMLGMSGQNVKVMIDGVPVIGRLDGNVDLSQVNLANIAQVEIVEGPMSVVYGNNALAGTINLITKQQHYHSTSVQANAYAESVGRYAVNASVAQKINKHNINFDGGYENFNGVDFDESTRSMDWKPKTLYRLNGGYGFNNNGWIVNAKAGIYSDELLYKGDITNYKAYDTKYFTNRYDFSANLNKAWGLNHVSVVAAYNIYDRSEQSFTKDLTTLESVYQDKETSQEANQKMFRGIYSRQMGLVSMQTGVDVSVEEMSGPRIVDGSQDIGDYAAFVNVKYNPVENLEIQPGLRYAYNTKYDAPLVYSINTKWDITSSWKWRASVAKGFRAPDIKELHYEFVDSNHEIYGNPHLEAESSNNYNTSIEYSKHGAISNWNISATAYYNDVENMISLIQEGSSTAYTYQNIDEYQSTGTNIDIKYAYKSLFSIRAGYGLTGRYNSYTEQNGSDRFNITHDFFSGIQITEPHTQITLSADYKYNGELPYFYVDSNDGTVTEGHQEAYHTMNASLSYNFCKNRLQVVAGAKNLFDVTNVNRVSGSSGAHSSGSGVPVSYGRSYFINLIYKFNKTKF